jgi:carboxyl-terminal processing protease
MRRTWRIWGLLWSALVGAAIASAQTSPDADSVPPSESIQYATQLGEVAKIVASKYVRPVKETDLVATGLRGLYKAADKTPPADLAERLARVGKNDLELRRLIAQFRREVGDSEAIRNSKAIQVTLGAVAESLDPYCSFVFDRSGASLKVPTFEFGLGLELESNANGCPVFVKKVSLGGPAQRAGLRPGDQIVELDHEPARLNLFDISKWSQSGLTTIGFKRPGESRLRRGAFKPEPVPGESVLGVSRRSDNSWDYWLDFPHRIAQIRISNLRNGDRNEPGTEVELNQVLSKLQAEGVAGIILDLRWCPGGYLSAAQAVADLFVGEYNLAYFLLPSPGDLISQADPFLDSHCENAFVQYRDGHVEIRARAPGPGFPLVPMIVLVNGDSSGGAELVAAVLQDNHRARVMGQRTRGKASVQSILYLLDDPALLLSYRIEGTLKISSGLLVRPSRKNFNRFPDSRKQDPWGVQPDPGLEYRVSPELSKQLQTWWTWQDLRPGNSNESLPLDNPEADPQRQAALRVLLRGR